MEKADLEPSNTVSKKSRSDNAGLPDLAIHARERRDLVWSQVSKLCFDRSADPAASVLSNSAHLTKLSFPFVGRAIPSRFNTNLEDDDSWSYMGRDKKV